MVVYMYIRFMSYSYLYCIYILLLLHLLLFLRVIQPITERQNRLTGSRSAINYWGALRGSGALMLGRLYR